MSSRLFQIFGSSDFQFALDPSQHGTDKEIDYSHFHIQNQRFIGNGSELLPDHRHFNDRDAGCQRSRFHQRNEVVHDSRQGNPDGLREDDPFQDLSVRHSQGVSRFPLASRDGQDCATDGFGRIGTAVQRESQDGSRPRIQGDVQLRQTEEDDEQLDQKRCAAEYPNVEPSQPFQQPAFRNPHDCSKDCQYKGQSKGNQRQGDGDGKPCFQNWP